MARIEPALFASPPHLLCAGRPRLERNGAPRKVGLDTRKATLIKRNISRNGTMKLQPRVVRIKSVGDSDQVAPQSTWDDILVMVWELRGFPSCKEQSVRARCVGETSSIPAEACLNVVHGREAAALDSGRSCQPLSAAGQSAWGVVHRRNHG